MKQHTEDYKQSAVKYYLEHNEDMRDTCEIFKCKFQSLARWIERYKQQGNINRKTRKNHNLKITPEIETFVKEYVRKYNTTTLWELSKLVNEKYKVHLTDRVFIIFYININLPEKDYEVNIILKRRKDKKKKILKPFIKS